MIQIVTDSSAHIPQDLIDRYRLHVVPLKVIFGADTYREGIDITNEQFYEMLGEAQDLPTTTQPAAGEFLEVYEKLAAAGDEIISIHLPSKLSGTYNSAMTAAKMLPEARIAVVDTPWISFALGMLVIQAAKAAEGGEGHDEVLRLIDELSSKMNIVFVVDTLEYLHRGGRIGGASALLGTLLKIKPLLELRDGQIEPLDRVRTKRAALRRLLEVFEERVGGPGASVHIGVLHANALPEAEAIESEIRSRFDVVESFFSEVGPVIGTHTGPGLVGLAFYAGVH